MQVQLAYRCALTLRDLINPFMLRRMKKDIKEVSSRQRALYEAYLKSDEVRNILRGMVRKQRKRIQTLPPQKTTLAMTTTLMAKNILWTDQWTKMLNIIQRFTALQRWKFLRMDGSTNVGSRQRMVDDFNGDDSYFGMLMTTRTGGVGLNLTGADRIILYDPDWNPQTDAQARERAWRFGQKNAVTVYRLITAGTIEEKIYHRQIFKTAVTNQVLQDPRQRRLFSQRDLRDLFTLKADVGSVAKGGDGCTETAAITKGAG
eukprot:15367115-Ditylum_brightwellii.AAC.1